MLNAVQEQAGITLTSAKATQLLAVTQLIASEPVVARKPEAMS